MGAFDYQALDERGKTKRGVASGDTARQVRQQLREQGLTPVAVEPVGEATGKRTAGRASRQTTSRRKISQTEIAVITRQFGTLLSSGLTIEGSLTALIEQAETHATKSTLTEVRSRVMEGSTLAESLRVFPRSFSELFTASVSAGEDTGKLDMVLDRLAEYTENREGLKQKISLALIYPLFLTLTAIGIVTFLMAYVVPKVIRVFADTGQELPALTKTLITMSDFIQSWGLLIVVLMLVGIVIFWIVFKAPAAKYQLHRFFLRVPLFKKLIRTINSAQMARTLAILVGSGVPLLSATKATEGVAANLVMREALRTASSEVTEGVSFGRALSRTGRFPPLLVQMVSSGESSGSLDIMLEKAAMAMEREVEARLGVVVGLFEPVMILAMGATVLTIVLAILLPIFDLNQLVT